MMYNNSGTWVAFDGLFWDDTESQLGIGTTNPEHRLELADHTTAEGGIALGSDVELYRSAANALTLASGDSFTIAGGSLITTGAFTQSGGAVNINVGSNYPTNINTGASTGAVSIGGNSNTVAVDSSSWNISTLGAASGFTSIASSGNIDLLSLNAGGLVKAAPTSGRLSVASAGADYEIPLTFSNGLTRTGTEASVVLGGSLTQNTTITQGTYNMTYNLTSSGDFEVQDNGATAFFVRDDGNVGIGTNNPTYDLQVSGSIIATDYFSGDGSKGAETATISGLTFKDGLYISGSISEDFLPSGVEGQMIYNNNGTWTAFSDMYWNDTNSRLGIGTTSPLSKLAVTGNAAIGSTYGNYSAPTNGAIIEGSVGIGTTNPGTYKLSVIGTANFTGAITAPTSADTINGLVINSGNITTGVWQGSTITVPYGGTGATTLTDHGVLVGSGDGAVTALTPGTDGQVLLGISGADPIFRALGGDIESISTTGTGPAIVPELLQDLMEQHI